MRDTEAYFAQWARSWDEAEAGSGPLGSVRFIKDKGARLFIPGARLLHLSFNGVDAIAEPAIDLFGITNNKYFYTLLGCIPGKTDPSGQEIISDTLLIGDKKFDHNAPISEIEFHLKGLENWVRCFGVPSLRNLSTYIETEPVLEKEIYDDGEKHIALVSCYAVSAKPSGSATFERTCKIVIRYNEEMFFEQALEDAYSILLLVSFCSGWYASFTKIRIANALDESFEVVGRFKDTKSSSFNTSESPISFEAFMRHSKETFAVWFSCPNELRTAIREYVPLATEDRFVYADLKFIAASQVLEAISRTPEYAIAVDAEQTQKRARLKTEAEELQEGELKKWVLGLLRKKRQPSLAASVRGVLANIRTYADLIIPDEEAFVDLHVDLRHDFVHRNPEVSSRADEYLLYHTHVVMMLCQAAIMKLIGFSDSETLAELERYKRNIRCRFASFYANDTAD